MIHKKCLSRGGDCTKNISGFFLAKFAITKLLPAILYKNPPKVRSFFVCIII